MLGRAGRLQSSQRTTICPSMPGSGSDAASASTASRAARERRRHGWTVTVRVARVATSRRPRPRRGRRPARREGSRARGDVGRRAPGARDRRPAGGSRRRRSGGAVRAPRASRSSRKIGSSRVRIHASPTGVRTGVSRPAQPVEGRGALSRRDAGPPGERSRRRGAEDVQVPARELEARVARVDLGWRDGPDRRLPRAVPSDRDRARRGGVPELVGMDAERAPRLAVRHPRTVEVREQARGEILRPPASLRIVGQPPEREERRGHAPPRRTRCTAAPRAGSSDGSSHVDGRFPRHARGSTGARLAACCPAGPPTPHAAASAVRRGSRSSSAPTWRRNARICARVRWSGRAVTSLPWGRREPGERDVAFCRPPSPQH